MKTGEPNNHLLSINLNGLVAFLNSKCVERFKLDSHHMQIIEEVVFLCLNESFIRDIQMMRSKIQTYFPDTFLPTQNTRQTRDLALLLGLKWHEKYKENINQIVRKYNLIPSLYWRDQFSLAHGRVLDKIQDKGVSKLEAENEIWNDRHNFYLPSLLDWIILQNTVFDPEEAWPSWINPHITKKSDSPLMFNMNIEEQFGITNLKISFPPYASLTEMKKILTDNYAKIQNFREERLPMPAKKDRRKTALPKMIDAYLMTKDGFNTAKITLALEEKYQSEMTFENVSKLIQRLEIGISRFNRDK